MAHSFIQNPIFFFYKNPEKKIQHIFSFCCIFFLPKKSSCAIHSIDLNVIFFFVRRRQKKNSCFIHSVDFFQKCGENELFQGKKNTAVFFFFWFLEKKIQLFTILSEWVDTNFFAEKKKIRYLWITKNTTTHRKSKDHEKLKLWAASSATRIHWAFT